MPRSFSALAAALCDKAASSSNTGRSACARSSAASRVFEPSCAIAAKLDAREPWQPRARPWYGARLETPPSRRQRGIDVEEEWIGVGAQLGHDEWDLRPSSGPRCKWTSRLSRSSLATITGALALRACSIAAFNSGRSSSRAALGLGEGLQELEAFSLSKRSERRLLRLQAQVLLRPWRARANPAI